MGFSLSIDCQNADAKKKVAVWLEGHFERWGTITGKGITHGRPILSPTDAPLKTATGFEVTGGVDSHEMFYLVRATQALAKLAGRPSYYWDDSESPVAEGLKTPLGSTAKTEAALDRLRENWQKAPPLQPEAPLSLPLPPQEGPALPRDKSRDR